MSLQVGPSTNPVDRVEDGVCDLLTEDNLVEDDGLDILTESLTIARETALCYNSWWVVMANMDGDRLMVFDRRGCQALPVALHCRGFGHSKVSGPGSRL